METMFWIIACIVLCFIAGHQANVIKKLRLERDKKSLDKDTIIKLQKETIDNQTATIKNYKKILANGVELKKS